METCSCLMGRPVRDGQDFTGMKLHGQPWVACPLINWMSLRYESQG